MGFVLFAISYFFMDDMGFVLFVPRSVLFKDNAGLVLFVPRCIFFSRMIWGWFCLHQDLYFSKITWGWFCVCTMVYIVQGWCQVGFVCTKISSFFSRMMQGFVLFVPRSVLFKDDGLVLFVQRCIFFSRMTWVGFVHAGQGAADLPPVRNRPFARRAQTPHPADGRAERRRPRGHRDAGQAGATPHHWSALFFLSVFRLIDDVPHNNYIQLICILKATTNSVPTHSGNVSWHHHRPVTVGFKTRRPYIRCRDARFCWQQDKMCGPQ